MYIENEVGRVEITTIANRGLNSERTMTDNMVLIKREEDGQLIAGLERGMTGYESFLVEPESKFYRDFIERAAEHGWTACAGGMGWPALYVVPESMAKARDELQLLGKE